MTGDWDLSGMYPIYNWAYSHGRYMIDIIQALDRPRDSQKIVGTRIRMRRISCTKKDVTCRRS